jgi:uncharacterized membrane protein
MRGAYDRIAGQSPARLAALSDGIFAVAMTLLVLDLRVPVEAAAQPSGEGGVEAALVALAPRLLTYVLSFATLGIFWIGQQAQVEHLARSDRTLTWIHLVFLLAVTLVPFSTSLLAAFITARLALLVYWLNLLLLGAALLGALRYAQRAGLLAADRSAAVVAANARRIVVFQVLYAAAALLCVFGTAWSIGALLVLQLGSVLAPRRGPLARL